MEFSDRLKAARESKGLTQVELAKILHVDPVVVSRYERGRSAPRAALLEGLANALDVTLDWLMLGRGDGPPPSGVHGRPPNPLLAHGDTE